VRDRNAVCDLQELVVMKVDVAGENRVRACVKFGSLDLKLSWQRKKNRNLPRAHLALTHPTPLYQHLLGNAGEYKMSGDKL
jgi:hypothetical protein